MASETLRSLAVFYTSLESILPTMKRLFSSIRSMDETICPCLLYTSTGLEPGVPYRVAFTYSDVYQYKLSATFNITGIVAETDSEDLELNEA